MLECDVNFNKIINVECDKLFNNVILLEFDKYNMIILDCDNSTKNLT